MRKVIVWAVVLLMATVLLPLGMTSAQRLREEPLRLGAETLGEGKLNLLIQEQVSASGGGNRPLRISLEGAIALVPPEQARFVGITGATLAAPVTKLVLNRACFAEFAGTHACTMNELLQSVPPPPEWPGNLIFVGDFGDASCLDGLGRFADCAASAPAAACCSGPVDD